ncbi:MAG TPA: protein kinase [Bryobacteraceae bacterium]|nr:protein kinase [Bryobacteraceae bacterium]
MPLAAGTRLGPYEILAPIGKGGMGEVYRARDPRLNRDVAIKVSSDEFSERFAREARSIAALNHPNICQIYDVGPNYLVMELVEGPTLAERIRQGAIPLEEALAIARQIGDALEAAHEQGITHRDLKPANIKIKPDGSSSNPSSSTVKVLDFGLAKMGGTTAARGEDSPTISMAATQAGVILGTAAYMSPEQARGKQVDKRADIWAFGVVLYEMLTGRSPFKGEDITDTLASVVKEQPTFEDVPPRVRGLVKACLQKDPKNRLRDIADAKLLLEGGAGSQPAAVSQTASRKPVVWIAAAGVLTLAALALGFLAYRYVTEEPPRVLKMSVLPPEKAAFKSNSLPAVSPDGRRLAFVATLDGKDELWVRDLDSLAARALTGTDGADEPFWSPDSRSIAFFAGGKLKKIDVAGGPALTLCDATGGRGGTWNKDGVIVFGVFNGAIFRVPAAGGGATALTALETASGEVDHRFPWFLPDGRHFLYTATNDAHVQAEEKGAIYASDVNSKNRKLVLAADSNAVYSPPGYLLFVRERTLMAQPFDAGKLQTTGDAIPIAEQIDSVGGRAAQNQFSISQNGVLAYTSGRGGGLELTWFDRSGKATGVLGTPNVVSWGAISPDGKTVAVERVDQGVADIWLHDLTRGAASRFTFGPRANEFPVWSPDGSHIAFYSARDPDRVGHPFQKATSGTGQDETLSKPLGEPPTDSRVDDWSRDGRYLILETANAKTKNDVWVLPTFGDRKPFPYLQTEFTERYGRLSPDGRWLAYTSDESKRDEIYVQSFPTPGGKWQVSTNGGERSVWSRDGKELYFVSLDGKMMAAEVPSGSKFEARFEAGVPKPLFDARLPGGNNRWFDVSKDGRFLIPIPAEQTANAPMTVVINWQAGLKK